MMNVIDETRVYLRHHPILLGTLETSRTVTPMATATEDEAAQDRTHGRGVRDANVQGRDDETTALTASALDLILVPVLVPVPGSTIAPETGIDGREDDRALARDLYRPARLFRHLTIEGIDGGRRSVRNGVMEVGNATRRIGRRRKRKRRCVICVNYILVYLVLNNMALSWQSFIC